MSRASAVAVAALLIVQNTVSGWGASPVQVVHPVLQASLERIARGSALWKADLDTISKTGRHAVVLTPDAVTVVDPQAPDQPQAFDSAVIAEVSPVRRNATDVEAVLVVVNLPLLVKAHDRRGSSQAERDADLDRILIHEVYGHAFPYLMAGHIGGRCPDPAPGERAQSACAIIRENAVRAELRLGRRTDYSLNSLNLARPSDWPPALIGDRQRH